MRGKLKNNVYALVFTIYVPKCLCKTTRDICPYVAKQ